MENFRKAMKYSLIFGLIGAVAVPLLYEVYANVSTAVGLVLMCVWVVCAGIKFSGLSFREAFVGITCSISYTGILGFVIYVLIHPAVQNLLMKNSVYFQLTYQQKFRFLLYAAIIHVSMYVLWLVRFGITCAFRKLKSNSDKTGEYIDNAFSDDGEKQ